MNEPVLIQDNGQAKFATRYHQRGDAVVSAGQRYEFDVTPAIKKIETDTRLGLMDALIDTAYGDGQSNIAQWLNTKQGIAATVHPQSNTNTVTPIRREGRLPQIAAKLEQGRNGWVLALKHQDSQSAYAPQAPKHIVTGQITSLRQDVIQDQISWLGQLAFRERRPDATAWLNDLDVRASDNKDTDYGVGFAVSHKSQGLLHITEPKLQPNFARRP